jgi:hypothetical protein
LPWVLTAAKWKIGAAKSRREAASRRATDAQNSLKTTRDNAVNAINVISPYKHHGMWVFDDPHVGLVQEPFVSGADTWIDRVVADIPNADKGFILIFSSTAFPGHQYRLDWRRAEAGEIGITRLIWTWRAGCAQLFSDTSLTPQLLYMPR